jgi:RNA-directed DNA polymerase
VKREDRSTKTKPFEIPKRLIWDSWKQVAANDGAPGVDKESIQMFHSRVGANLYTLWNRMSSGSYYPKPVRQVLIPKGDGKLRALGIPTVADRVAQMAVKNVLEGRMEALFHPTSYGYRLGKNAQQAVGQARRNCWSFAWVVDLDIRAFFDTIDHGLMMRAVKKHVPEKWIRLYIERWLKCVVHTADGTMHEPNCGVPQGGVITPLTTLYN